MSGLVKEWISSTSIILILFTPLAELATAELYSGLESARGTVLRKDRHYSQLLDKLLSVPVDARYAMVTMGSSSRAILIVEDRDRVKATSINVHRSELQSDIVREIHLDKTFDQLIEELDPARLEELNDNTENTRFTADGSTYNVTLKLATKIKRFSVYAPENFSTLSYCRVIDLLFAACDPDPSRCLDLDCRDYPPLYPKGFPDD